MMAEQYHKMQLETTHSSGAEEWACPECGRRFVAQWAPNFRRVILERGNEMMIHKSQGMSLQTQISLNSSEDNVPNGTELNEVWKQLLDKLDIDLEDDNDSDY